MWLHQRRTDRRETSAQAAESSAAGEHAYPSDLAALVLTRWHEATAAGQINLTAPAISTLAGVLSICYQATLLREEGRPVTFRLALSEPSAFDLRQQFGEVMATRTFELDDVASGRAYVKAYVEFIHVVERLYDSTMNDPHGHFEERDVPSTQH